MFYKKENKIIKGSINNLAEAKKIIYEIKLEKIEKIRKKKRGIDRRLNKLIIVKQKAPKETAFVSYLKINKENNKDQLNILKEDIFNNMSTNKKKIVKYVKVTSKYSKFADKSPIDFNIFSEISDGSDKSIITDFNKEDENKNENDIVNYNNNQKNAPPIRNQNNLDKKITEESKTKINKKKIVIIIQMNKIKIKLMIKI